MRHHSEDLMRFNKFLNYLNWHCFDHKIICFHRISCLSLTENIFRKIKAIYLSVCFLFWLCIFTRAVWFTKPQIWQAPLQLVCKYSNFNNFLISQSFDQTYIKMLGLKSSILPDIFTFCIAFPFKLIIAFFRFQIFQIFTVSQQFGVLCWSITTGVFVLYHNSLGIVFIFLFCSSVIGPSSSPNSRNPSECCGFPAISSIALASKFLSNALFGLVV